MSVAMKLNQVFSTLSASRKQNTTTETATKATITSVTQTQAPTQNSTSSSLKTLTTTHKSGVFFEEVETKIQKEGATMVSKVNAIIGFNVDCGNGRVVSYIVDLKNAPGSVYPSNGSIFFNIHIISDFCIQNLKYSFHFLKRR